MPHRCSPGVSSEAPAGRPSRRDSAEHRRHAPVNWVSRGPARVEPYDSLAPSGTENDTRGAASPARRAGAPEDADATGHGARHHGQARDRLFRRPPTRRRRPRLLAVAGTSDGPGRNGARATRLTHLRGVRDMRWGHSREAAGGLSAGHALSQLPGTGGEGSPACSPGRTRPHQAVSRSPSHYPWRAGLQSFRVGVTARQCGSVIVSRPGGNS